MLKASLTMVIAIAMLGFFWHLRSGFDVKRVVNSSHLEYFQLLSRADKETSEKKFDLAERTFARAIELKPAYFAAYNNRGCMRIFSENYSDAIKDFDTAIEIAPEFDSGYINRGIALVKSGDKDGALRDFNHAVMLNPVKENFIHRGDLRLLLEDTDGAESDFAIARGVKGHRSLPQASNANAPGLHCATKLVLESP